MTRRQRVFSILAVLVAIVPAVAVAGRPGDKSRKTDPSLMRPFWQGETVYGESVLFIEDPETGEPRATLLFPVREVLAVRNSAGDMTYQQGRDYLWKPESREITLPAGSRIASRTLRDLRRPANSQKFQLTHRDGNGEILFGAKLEYHDMQTCITYRHAPNLFRAPVPKFDEKSLPRTIKKLREGRLLSLVVLGDSISTGCNASGWAKGAPFQPAYAELLREHLVSHYQSSVNLRNLSVAGTTSRWGVTMIDKVVDVRPDLVILAFGMNDAAGVAAKDYQANMNAMMAGIRRKLPDCEFILVASMLGNPAWIRLKQPLFFEYRDALAELCGPGTALADMTSIWKGLLSSKRYCDLTGNGVNHPNDFGHRIYAQVLSTLLVAPAR